MTPRPIDWLAGTAIVLALGWTASCDYEDQQAQAAHTKETMQAAQRRSADEARAKTEAQALAHHLYEQHLLDDANHMLHPLGQARIAAITRRENQ